jgi:hypothetical protein
VTQAVASGAWFVLGEWKSYCIPYRVARSAAIVRLSLILALLGACSVPATDSTPDMIYSSPDLLQQLKPQVSPARNQAFRRAAVWSTTNVEAVDIRRGPSASGGFPFLASVNCEYVDEPLSGHSMKFACDAGNGDVVKVKFGEANGEVYGEVAATRLLWALGFGADRMYPVRVTCRGCPSRFGGVRLSSGDVLFDPAVVERSMTGARFEDDPGWSWSELELVEERDGGAPRAHRDALKLLAVFLQHGDNKTEQQRLLCVDEPLSKRPEHCARPFLMIDDVGLTFGRANFVNHNAVAGANLERWSRTPVWRDGSSCVGNLPRSFTGTLSNPQISEEGRQFLADLLLRLSPRQIHDLFEIGRLDLRVKSAGQPQEGVIDEWVRVFNRKRDEIATRRCQRGSSRTAGNG